MEEDLSHYSRKAKLSLDKAATSKPKINLRQGTASTNSSFSHHLNYPGHMAGGNTFSRLKGRLLPGPFARGFAWYSLVIASWIPAAIFFKDNVGAIGEVGGESMYPYLNPTFNQGFAKDLCWISKRRPATNLQRGMIVTFWYVYPWQSRIGSLHICPCRSPSHPEVLSIKRVIALPGDKVITKAPHPYPTAVVPVNHIWVEGDNKDGRKTLDSNHYGPISMGLITGRVTYILRPWKGQVRWWEFEGSRRVLKGRIEEAPSFD
jgi:inner membrane protease subunit 2